MKKSLREASAEKKQLSQMRKSFATVRTRQRDNAGRIPDLAERKTRLKAARECAVGNRNLLEEAVKNLKAWYRGKAG
ncbi:MAG: hypothetical protein PHV74_12365 [Dehalococcoidia bacterium]|nr:hypothetical protein [Dehalococcoidia bacterium]